MRNFILKLVSRKLWVAMTGIVGGLVTDNPVVAAISGGVYMIAQGLVDAFGGRKEPAQEEGGDAVQQ